MIRTRPPEVIQNRIIRVQAELRRLRMELRLSRAEQRDSERLQQTFAKSAQGTAGIDHGGKHE